MAYSKERVFSTSVSYGEKNDCTVKALALSTKLSYEDAHELLRLRGRKNGRGCHSYVWGPAFNDAGYTLVPVFIKAKTVMGIEKDPNFKKSNNYVVLVRGHILAVRDKKVLDWTNGRRHRILAVYKVEKTS